MILRFDKFIDEVEIDLTNPRTKLRGYKYKGERASSIELTASEFRMLQDERDGFKLLQMIEMMMENKGYKEEKVESLVREINSYIKNMVKCEGCINHIYIKGSADACKLHKKQVIVNEEWYSNCAMKE